MKKIPPRKLVDDMLEFSETQSHGSDICIETMFIGLHNPIHIVELGTCYAGWPIYVDRMLKYKPKMFTLIENFIGGEWNHSKSLKHNKDLLIGRLKEKNFSSPYIIKTDNEPMSNYDVFRYDGYSDYATFKNYVDNADEDSLIILHDTNINGEVGPLFYAMQYGFEKGLYPVWFGKLSSLWTKNREYKTHITNSFLKSYNIDILRRSWLKVKYRPEFSWTNVNSLFLEYQNTILSS